MLITAFLVVVAVFGPLIAPYSPNAFVAAPNSPPELAPAVRRRCARPRRLEPVPARRRSACSACRSASTLVGVGVGLVVGLTAAYIGGVVDEILMRIADVFMAFPQIVLALLLVTAFGPKVWLIILTVGISHAPRVARVIRGAALAGGGAGLRQGRRGGRRATKTDHLRRAAAQRDEPAAG